MRDFVLFSRTRCGNSMESGASKMISQRKRWNHSIVERFAEAGRCRGWVRNLKNHGIALDGEILRHLSEYLGDFGIFTEKFKIGGARAR